MLTNYSGFGLKIQKQTTRHTPRYVWFCTFITIWIFVSSTGAVTLTGSSEYAVPGTEFTLTCDVPEEANVVLFYRRHNVTIPVGSIQVAGAQCYNTIVSPPVPCTSDVCSCDITSGDNLGTVFRWIIHPQTGDQGSVWFCRRTNFNLPNTDGDSDDYTLNMADGPGTSIALSPPDATYTRTEGDRLSDITCTADCRPDCTFVWTRPDNTNFTVSSVLSLGQLDRSKHGTYKCTASNVAGESTITISVNIQYNPGSSIALSPPDTTYIRTEGDTLPDITCTADCRPNCTFVWTRPDNTNFTVSSVLSLGQLDRSEHGTYRCTARNVVGESTTSIIITVMYGPGSSLTFSPQRTSYNEIEGDTLPDITCTADCRPDCTFVWTRPDNTNSTVSPVLSLGQLDRSEHGTYRCTARNVVQETTKIISVTVQCEPHPYQILHQNQTIDLQQSETLVLQATFTAVPAPSFSWTFQSSKSVNVQQLVNGTDDILIQNTFDTENISARSVVTRQSIEKDWFGMYKVTATNAFGTAVLRFTVREKINPGIPTISLAACTQPNSAEVSWIGGGDTQYYQVVFSDDRFLNSNQASPSTIPSQADRSDGYSLTIENLVTGQAYFFKVTAYNSYGNTTSTEAVGCVVREENNCGTDGVFVTGVVLAVVGVISLIISVGLVIFVTRNRLVCCSPDQIPKPDKYQDIQLSDQDDVRQSNTDRSPYQHLDTSKVAKPSVYSEIGKHHQGSENDNDGNGGPYESLEGRSNPNHYEELQSKPSDNSETYINTIIPGDC